MKLSDLTNGLRRVVTGMNAEGRSVVVFDGPPPQQAGVPDAGGMYEIWSEGAAPLDPSDRTDFASGPVRLTPDAGGLKIRWFAMAPTPPDMDRETLEAMMSATIEAIGAGDHRPDTTRHPGMHLTPTLDAVILLRGQVRLLLDDDETVLKPGDVVVQRATNHAWVVEGDEPALMVAVLIDRPATLDT